MEYLKNSNTIENLFDFNKNSNLYEEYEKYLDYYYKLPSSTDKYGREYIDGKFILYELKDPKKKIIIQPSKTINLFYLQKKLNLQKNIILEEISYIIEKPENLTNNDRKTFDDLKIKYALYSKKIQEIDEINKTQHKKNEEILFKKIENAQRMAKYYIERQALFKKIESPISKSSKNKFIQTFHTHKNKIPDQTFINNISKQENVPSNQTEIWFEWIEKCYHYLLARKDLYKSIEELNETLKEFDEKASDFMIQKPIIEKVE